MTSVLLEALATLVPPLERFGGFAARFMTEGDMSPCIWAQSERSSASYPRLSLVSV
jgi:hypothetical protein